MPDIPIILLGCPVSIPARGRSALPGPAHFAPNLWGRCYLDAAPPRPHRSYQRKYARRPRGAFLTENVPIRLLRSRGNMARSPDSHGAGERRSIVFSDLSVEPGNAWTCPGQGRNAQEPPACAGSMEVYPCLSQVRLEVYPCLSQVRLEVYDEVHLEVARRKLELGARTSSVRILAGARMLSPRLPSLPRPRSNCRARPAKTPRRALT